MSRKRLSKKQLKRDKFVEHTFDWAHWAESHRTQVLAALAGIAVLVAAFFVYRSLARAGEEDAARSYIEARQAYFSGNYPLAVSDLQAFIDSHGDSSYGDDARIFLADALYQAGDPQAAVETLQWFHSHEDSPFAVNALLLEAAAYQATGSLDAAAETYRQALERTDVEAQRVQILSSLADVYELKGETDQAAAQLRAIVDLDPEAPAADLARRKLAELTAQPLSAASPPAGRAPAPEASGAAEADSAQGEG